MSATDEVRVALESVADILRAAGYDDGVKDEAVATRARRASNSIYPVRLFAAWIARTPEAAAILLMALKGTERSSEPGKAPSVAQEASGRFGAASDTPGADETSLSDLESLATNGVVLRDGGGRLHARVQTAGGVRTVEVVGPVGTQAVKARESERSPIVVVPYEAFIAGDAERVREAMRPLPGYNDSVFFDDFHDFSLPNPPHPDNLSGEGGEVEDAKEEGSV